MKRLFFVSFLFSAVSYGQSVETPRKIPALVGPGLCLKSTATSLQWASCVAGGSGISSLNGLSVSPQSFSVGSSGTDFSISSSGSTHSFLIPTASNLNRGLLSAADWNLFNSKQNALGAASGDLSGTYPNLTVTAGSIDDAKISGVSGSKIAGDISGNSENVNGVISVGHGGTGATTANNAKLNLEIQPTVTVFNSSGTFVKKTSSKFVAVLLVGGGGGGGSGRQGAAGTVRSGGGGGASGAISEFTYNAANLAASETVTVGARALGGAAISTIDTNGASGQPGISTVFSSNAALTLVARGGGQGAGGGTGAAAGGAAAAGRFAGSSGASSSSTGAGGTAGNTGFSGGSGASGAGITTANAQSAGGVGGGLPLDRSAVTTGGGAAGSVGGGSGGNGVSSVLNSGLAGSGGGSGGSSLTTAGGSGGNGGDYGSGGGGGGASVNGFSSGKGGDGGLGVAIITEW